MTSLCLIADTHCKHRELVIPECDILIHAGDFCRFHKDDERVLNDVDSWFAEVPAKHVICIGGNHDFLLQSGEFSFTNATVLEDSLVELEGLSFYGSPRCPELVNFAYYATDEELLERWGKIPSGIDVLITHTPPHGILDVPSSGNYHLGCPHLMAELKRIQPRLHVFGHIHASHGTLQQDGTKFANAAAFRGPDLAVSHSPIQVSLDRRALEQLADRV
ncbi:metallophosphatase domain-containing protein [Akkermansiaceae bacterium]|nr:metallophosphatase domain-containing protein [Akkermansiaceae bacterium]